MIDNNVRFEILRRYEKVFPLHYDRMGWVNDYIKKYKIDPCDHKTITKAINNLNEKLKKTILPEIYFPKEYRDKIAFAHPGFANPEKISLKRLKEEYKCYKGMSREKGDAIFRKYGDIEYDIKILDKWSEITEYCVPEDNEINIDLGSEELNKEVSIIRNQVKSLRAAGTKKGIPTKAKNKVDNNILKKFKDKEMPGKKRITYFNGMDRAGFITLFFKHLDIEDLIDLDGFINLFTK